MDNKYTIRKAEPSDAESIIKLMNEVAGETDYLSFEKGAIKIPVEVEAKYIQNVLDKDNCLILVCETKNQIVAMLDFSASFKKRMRHCGEFGIMVKKNYWRKGISKKLIEELFYWSKETKIIHKINLKVREDNLPATKLYENMGFVKEGQVSREYLIDGIFHGAILMGKEI